MYTIFFATEIHEIGDELILSVSTIELNNKIERLIKLRIYGAEWAVSIHMWKTDSWMNCIKSSVCFLSEVNQVEDWDEIDWLKKSLNTDFRSFSGILIPHQEKTSFKIVFRFVSLVCHISVSLMIQDSINFILYTCFRFRFCF